MMLVLYSAVLLSAGAVRYDGTSPPKLIQGLTNMTIKPGALFQMECKAEGTPTPKLTITRLEEASLERVKTRNYTGMELKMSITHVIYKSQTVQLQDEGWYRCVAANSQGVVYSDAFMTVYDLCRELNCRGGKICVPEGDSAKCICRECSDLSYNPLCGTDCVTHFNYCQLEHKNCLRGTKYTAFLKGTFCPLFTPPRFLETPPPEVDVVEGKAFTLTCRASSDGDTPGPPPLISWYKANMVAPTEDSEAPTAYEPDFGAKLGDGETIKLRTTEYMDVVCVAHQCQYGQTMPQDIVSDPVFVSVAVAEVNAWNGGPSCQIFGDPHIITFDDVSYEYEGRCEYVLAMDCEEKAWFVYGSFDTCSTHGRGACLVSVTLYVNHDIAIEVSRGMLVNYDGKRVHVPERGLQTITGKDGSVVYLFLRDDWMVLKFNNGGDTHYELRWDGLMSAQILLGKNAPRTCGLCGNANEDPTDDFQLRWSGRVTTSVEKFGDSWKIDRGRRCKKTSRLPKWEWQKEFSEKIDEATTICNKIFNTTQLSKCALGSTDSLGATVNPEPYRSACISDYARSDFFPEDMSGQNMACVAAMNYAERCGNNHNKNHLWREECGCAGETEELAEFKKFLGEFSCY